MPIIRKEPLNDSIMTKVDASSIIKHVSITGKPPNFAEIMEMMRKLNHFVSAQQPHLQHLISEVELPLANIYLKSSNSSLILK